MHDHSGEIMTAHAVNRVSISVPQAVAPEHRLRATIQSLDDLELAREIGLFSHPDYLRARGHSELMVVDRPEPASPAIFDWNGGCALYLGRLDALSGREIDELSSAVLHDTSARAVVFEDIVLQDDLRAIDRPVRRYRYQANWRRDFKPGDKLLTSRQASNARRRMRRLDEQVGDPSQIRFEFRRCCPGDVAAVAFLNKIKIEHAGRRHRFTEQKQQIMEKVAAKIGYISSLYVGDEMIGGTIIYVVGKHAYFANIGYDLDYAKFAPGIQVYVASIEHLEKLGCREINFLWGDSRFKHELGAERQQLSTVIVRRGWRSYLCRHFWKTTAHFLGRDLRCRAKTLAVSIRDRVRQRIETLRRASSS